MIEIPESLISLIRRRAETGISDGRENARNRAYISECNLYHANTGTIVIFTRDEGIHSSGWMKNPDYERCYHLSLSFREPQPDMSVGSLIKIATAVQFGLVVPLAPFSTDRARPWVEKVLYPNAHLSWMESPFSDVGKQCDVRHWRLFCDPAWQPIKPRGEVYNTDFTDRGWRSWSELNEPMPSHVNAD